MENIGSTGVHGWRRNDSRRNHHPPPPQKPTPAPPQPEIAAYVFVAATPYPPQYLSSNPPQTIPEKNASFAFPSLETQPFFPAMCMCSSCAKVLRCQTNRYPICRQPVERLLEIKVNKGPDE